MLTVNNREIRARLQKAFIVSLLILVVGFGYLFWVTSTGIYIPCKFNMLTGLKCPGCGISHLCMNIYSFIITGETKFIREAYGSNQYIFIMSPILAGLVIYSIYKWVKTGEVKINTIFVWALVASTILWGILRNL